MIYGSVCSGIEAATTAWHQLGWEPAFFSEIEKFPRAVLQHHWPEVPLHGDFTTIGENEYGPIDLLVGGTPCQSFSIAGLRKGMDDDRGNLALEFLRLADRKRPSWVVWENVPGCLSTNGGRDFGSFLGGLAELGYGFAYRILDAKNFGVAQRRRRVFVVGYTGDWRPPAAVLFERQSMSRDTEKSQEKERGFQTARTLVRGADTRSGTETDIINCTFNGESVFPTLDRTTDSKGWCNQAVKGGYGVLHASSGQTNASINVEAAGTLNCNGDGAGYVSHPEIVPRKLTPKEAERLQGFPDDHTKIPWRGKDADLCPDGPRYKAVGNSMAVPVMKWIGERIQIANSTFIKDYYETKEV